MESTFTVEYYYLAYVWKREEDSSLYYCLGLSTFVDIERSAVKSYTVVRFVDVIL